MPATGDGDDGSGDNVWHHPQVNAVLPTLQTTFDAADLRRGCVRKNLLTASQKYSLEDANNVTSAHNEKLIQFLQPGGIRSFRKFLEVLIEDFPSHYRPFHTRLEEAALIYIYDDQFEFGKSP